MDRGKEKFWGSIRLWPIEILIFIIGGFITLGGAGWQLKTQNDKLEEHAALIAGLRSDASSLQTGQAVINQKVDDIHDDVKEIRAIVTSEETSKQKEIRKGSAAELNVEPKHIN